MDAADWYRQGAHHAERFRFEDARQALEQAVALGAGADGLALLSAVRGELGDAEGAAGDLERAAALRPDDPAIALLDATLLPALYRDAADLERWRARYTQRLAAIAADLGRYRRQAGRILGLARSNFLLAYQGRDDVALQAQLADVLGSLLREAAPGCFEPRRRAAGKRIRVGFASAFLFDCTVGRYFGSWIEGLDPARFEVIAFMTGAASDTYTERLSRSCHPLHAVGLPVIEVARCIAAAELDVLVYPEVGMDPRCRLLSCMRLAPVQLAAWGHPQTTGSREIDGFITCGDMEAPGSDRHYTERLHALPGLGVAYEPPAMAPAFTRAELKMDDARRLYCCPHSLFKVHPDSDAMFAELLARDPGSVLVLFQAQNAGPAPGQALAARLARALEARGVAPGRQLRLLPRMSPASFRRALQAMDVVLDPLHWSGGNTALDALGAGVPVVAVPGELMRSRQAAAMLRQLDAAECVAANPEAAVALAGDLARDTDRRAKLRDRITTHAPRLFSDPRPLSALSELLDSLARP